MIRRHRQQLEAVPDLVLTLLSEITASTSRHEVPENAEAKLMRLAADPFLLRRHVCEIGGGGDGETPGPQRTPQALGPWISNMGAETESASKALSKGRHYHSAEPQMGTSLLPEIFAATDDDVANALEGYPESHARILQEGVRDESFVSILVIRASLLFFLAVLVVAALSGLYLK